MDNAVSKRRKGYRNSRRGCGNCKLRRVKCDEQHPSCQRCRNAHMACDYEKTFTTLLESSHEKSLAHVSLDKPRCSTNVAMLNMINGVLSQHDSGRTVTGTPFQLTHDDLKILLRFQHKIDTSFGPMMQLSGWRDHAFRLMAENSYLLHTIMTVTAMHDRFLASQGHSKRTPWESYHWATASQLLNQQIANQSQGYDPDALWMGAAMMSWIMLFTVETQNPQEVWPLSDGASNIPWLPIQKGLRTIWSMTNPERPGSVFYTTRGISPGHRCLGLPPPKPGIDGIPQFLVDLCGLDESSTQSTNPYHTAVRALSPLLDMPPSSPGSLAFLAFVNTIEPEFEHLLGERDPRALVLMALWYDTVPPTAWWISLRASLERQAICTYLNRLHGNDTLVRPFLDSLTTAE